LLTCVEFCPTLAGSTSDTDFVQFTVQHRQGGAGYFSNEHGFLVESSKVTRHFIEFVVVETKRFVGSDVKVILHLFTPSARLAAGSKRQALAFIFSIRI